MGHIGAKDKIDRALVNRYANIQTIIIDPYKTVATDKMWQIMSQVSNYNKVMMEVKSIKKQVQGLAPNAKKAVI